MTKAHGIFLLVLAAVFQLMSYFICDGECTDYLTTIVAIKYAFSTHIADVYCSDPGPGSGCASKTLVYLSYGCVIFGMLILTMVAERSKGRKDK